MKERSALIGWFVVVLAGIVAPGVILILIAMTPNTPIRAGAAGRFVSSTASAGGFMAPNITTVQTTTGSIAVYNAFSAPRNEVLVVQETLKNGVQLCAEGKPDTCVDLMGSWAGDMNPIAHADHVFAGLVTGIGTGGAALWLLIGVFLSIGATAILAQTTEAARHEAKQTA